MRALRSLKARLGLGAACLVFAALAAVMILGAGMQRMSVSLQASLSAEDRVERYATLSTQASTFIVVAAELAQSGLPAEARRERLEALTDNIMRTFGRLRDDVQQAVREADTLGFDERSRRATQSIAIARMEALFATVRDGFLSGPADPERLRGLVDVFAAGFDPLLTGAVADEMRVRARILTGIEELQRRLTLIAYSIAAATVLALSLFHFGLVRPQFRRLDMLRGAAQRIGQQDFAVTLPVDRDDEIGRVFAEINRMAEALSARKAAVDADWARLSETVAERTEELRAANARLARIDADRRRFFADISHELRTPLTVILMEAQIGRAGNPDPVAAFATIEARAMRLNRRIDDLIRIARSESGQLALDSGPFDLDEAAHAAVEETRLELEAADMTLETSIDGPLPVTGDGNWTRQVVASLIRNAIRHARSGGQLRVDARAEGGAARIEVTDAGLGIPKELQDTVFDRFAQGDGGARSEGFGIGLALARWVMHEQGGTIGIESPAGDGPAPGLRATVGLPLRTG
ncbi:sensor histidine kinase [Roseivivax sediminis]|uniref:histidine kinase n=1 Tax=Roseivivax sediminis TaxID=936889 RepID=A0A1I1VNV5_9RHOB|nr:HAMP domain-containing sensor histidine kinase [Roseivivax sediminis]SFD83748.1 hypothetical protein SAMN04515678_103273 [Roseivivax sediminis]